MQVEKLPSFLIACSFWSSHLHKARRGEGEGCPDPKDPTEEKRECCCFFGFVLVKGLDFKEDKRTGAKGSHPLFHFSLQLDPLSMVLIKRIIYLIAWNHPENSLSPTVLHYLAWLPGEVVMSC